MSEHNVSAALLELMHVVALVMHNTNVMMQMSLRHTNTLEAAKMCKGKGFGLHGL